MQESVAVGSCVPGMEIIKINTYNNYNVMVIIIPYSAYISRVKIFGF